MTTATRRSVRTAALGITAVGFALLLTGCNTSAHAGDENAIRNNPSAALSGLGVRSQDRYNRWAYMKDTNYRALSDDIARTLYIDRPSRLHRSIKTY